jgi:DNA repair protein RAD16
MYFLKAFLSNESDRKIFSISSVCRRTKIERADDLGLPPRIVDIRRDYFNEEEEDFYQALYSESRTQFARYVRAGTVLNNYAHMYDFYLLTQSSITCSFELLSKLRQAADHPFLVVHHRPNELNPGTYVCGLCHDVCEEPIAARCKHVFCREDIRQYMESYIAESKPAQCPVCFVNLSINLDQDELPIPEFSADKQNTNPHNSSIVNRMLQNQGWSSSTKIEALLEELTKLRESDHTIKSIIFSQFVSFLDLIHWRLRSAGFHCVKLDGRMTPEQRNSVIQTFMTVPQVTVFLVSLKVGPPICLGSS